VGDRHLNFHDARDNLPTGEQESREEYLLSVASGELDYHALEPISPVDVSVSGRVGMVTSRSHFEVTVGAIRVEHAAWYTHVCEKHHDQWQQVWASPPCFVGGGVSVTSDRPGWGYAQDEFVGGVGTAYVTCLVRLAATSPRMSSPVPAS